MAETDIVFKRKFKDGTNFGNPQIVKVYCPECGWICHSNGCDNEDCINYSQSHGDKNNE